LKFGCCALPISVIIFVTPENIDLINGYAKCGFVVMNNAKIKLS